MREVTDKPNLFFVGYPKCGTTALYHYLKNHSKITVSQPKEPKAFFARDLLEEEENFSNNKTKYIRYRDEETYLKVFSKPNKYVAEFSTPYAYSKKAAREIKKYNADAKIVMFIREPVSFLYSYHNQRLLDNIETEPDFESALRLEKDRKEGKGLPKYCPIPYLLFYSELVKYDKSIERYLDAFGKENVQIYLFEDFKKDNQKVVDEICAFLDIDSIKINRREKNTRSKIRFQSLRNWAKRTYNENEIVRRLVQKENGSDRPRPALKKFFDFVTVSSKGDRSISRSVEKKLKKKFKENVVRTDNVLNSNDFIDKDLVDYWGY